METLKFYDMKEKKAFMADQYEIKIKGQRRFAIAKAPSGVDSYRILGKEKN